MNTGSFQVLQVPNEKLAPLILDQALTWGLYVQDAAPRKCQNITNTLLTGLSRIFEWNKHSPTKGLSSGTVLLLLMKWEGLTPVLTLPPGAFGLGKAITPDSVDVTPPLDNN